MAPCSSRPGSRAARWPGSTRSTGVPACGPTTPATCTGVKQLTCISVSSSSTVRVAQSTMCGPGGCARISRKRRTGPVGEAGASGSMSQSPPSTSLQPMPSRRSSAGFIQTMRPSSSHSSTPAGSWRKSSRKSRGGGLALSSCMRSRVDPWRGSVPPVRRHNGPSLSNFSGCGASHGAVGRAAGAAGRACRQVEGYCPSGSCGVALATAREGRLQSALKGSAASRRPSPRKLKASTVTITGTTGSISHG